jgi:hypothetical protein
VSKPQKKIVVGLIGHAGRHQELEQVLTSAEWLSASLTRFTLASAVDDFRPALKHAALRSVGDAHLLSNVEIGAMMAA